MLMSATFSFIVVMSVAVLCAASPLLAQNAEQSAEPSMVFIPQAQPKLRTILKGRGIARKATPKFRRAIAPPKSTAPVSETFQDWVVNCVTINESKFCTASQALTNKGTGQRVFAIELRRSKDGSTEGTILMPLGLKLDAGVVIKVDNEEQKLHFSTCLTQGCLVAVTLPTSATDAIQKAKTFTVSAQTLNDNRVITFDVSLNGFAAALERVIKISG